MYVNTLITLQENLSTYGIDGKKVTGHVTITSPGLIKCYVQNLKKQGSGQTYALYAFSKTKDKGIRLGSLGNEKETKWMIDGNNIVDSQMNLEELDGVAIVVEDDMRGVDTILMGFKNNRYMIIPLIDDIFKKRIRPGKPGNSPSKPGSSEKPLPKPGKPINPPPRPECPPHVPHKPSKPGNPLPKPVCPDKPLPKPVCPDKPLPKPDCPQNPPSKPGYSPPRNDIKTGTMIEPEPLEEGVGPVIIPQPGMQPQGGMGPTHTPQPGMQPQQGGMGPFNIPQPDIQHQGDMGPVVPQGGLGPAIISVGTQPYGNMQPQDQHIGSVQTQMNVLQGPHMGMPKEEQHMVQGQGEFTKVKILDKKPENKTQGERIESVELDLIKITERLKQIGKVLSEKQNIEPETVESWNNVSEEAQVREDVKNDSDEVAKELQRIINMLKENQEIKQKTKGIEVQIERMRQLPQSHKLVQKSDLEKNLESRYMAQQLMDEEQNNEEEEESIDTSPKNALNFMSFGKQEPLLEEGLEMQANHQAEDLGQKENIDDQNEIDYIYEIDKKIREIEARRKQQENNR